MTPELIGSLGFTALFIMIAFGTPVAIALMICGFVGTVILSSWTAATVTMSGQVFSSVSVYELSIVPLFVLMGNLATASGLSRDLFDAAYRLVGHFRAGLAMATIVGSAGFAALSGSSIASAVTMGKVAYPEMRRYNYGNRLASGSIAAGGTLGILIPPSTGFVIFAVLTEESIGQLFMAGILPGLMLASLFIVAILIISYFAPEEGPKGPRFSWEERGRAIQRATFILTIIGVTIGGIYTGTLTPVEAAGVGAFFAFCALIVRRKLSVATLLSVSRETLQTTGMVFFILIGAHLFGPFVSRSNLSEGFSHAMTSLEFSALATLLIILAGYALLGMVIEGLSLLVITLPIVFPLLVQLGYDPIWIGVIMVIVLEMGLISPPIGVVVFVVKSILPDVKMETIFAGIIPFWLAMFVALGLLIAFPQIALVIPNAMFN